MSGQKFANQTDRPLLQCFGQDGVIRIRKGVIDNLPGLVVAQLFFVKQDAQELYSADGGVSIVKLDLVK